METKCFAKAFAKAKKRKLHIPQASVSETSAIDVQPRSKKKMKIRPPKKKSESLILHCSKKKLSQAALNLSAQLKSFSQQKQLTEALQAYWDTTNDGIRDGFHACITIDCCARCGAMEQIEKILQNLKASGQTISIETNTSAIKGFVHGGDMTSAYSIFVSMCQSKQESLKPNVRTLNQMIRGCLWTAATVDSDDRISGGVITSEAAWQLYKAFGQINYGQSKPQVDLSSYEYSVTLLCQALQLEKAEIRIEEMKRAYNVDVTKDTITGGNSAVFETLSMAYLALARGKALIGDKVGAIQDGNFAWRALEASRNRQASDCYDINDTLNIGSVSGEKRAWKVNEDDRRKKSNELFRNHRLQEFELELASILELCQSSTLPTSTVLATRLVTGLFYFSGGATSKLSGTDMNKNTGGNKSTAGRRLRRHVINSSWLSFGLQPVLKRADLSMTLPADFMRIKDADRVFRIAGKTIKPVQDDGSIDFDKLFPKAEKKQVDIELGSGHGDWIVHQAAGAPKRNHIAVELRADRVYSTFVKGFLRKSGPLENLCVVGDDCKAFLRDRCKPNSVATIFVNHPEPPTQVLGRSAGETKAIMDGSSAEPAHMLNSSTLIAAGKCLQRDTGSIVIVTDNINYARLICATVVKISRQADSWLRSRKVDLKRSALREVETFSLMNVNTDRVVIFEGYPSSAIGHVESSSSKQKGSSYFDRLWKTGASAHASSAERYILLLEQA